MARTRAHRRRQTLRVVVALAVTFVVLVFGREVSHFAHQEASVRRSENLSFSSVATTLLEEENSFDTRLDTLLSTGSDMPRVSFAADLTELTQQVSSWQASAEQLRTPVLTPDLNVILADETLTRVKDYQRILADVALGLDLETSGPTADSALSLGSAQLSLSATAASWGEQRHELAEAPGHVTLIALTNETARLAVPELVQTLAASATLSASRAVQIAAVQVQPAPLPAPARSIELIPTSALQVQVAVTNLREIVQPVILTMVFAPASGTTQSMSQTRTLSPLSSYAFASHVFAVHPGEKGTLTLTLSAQPASGGLVHQRVYSVSVASAAAG